MLGGNRTYQSVVQIEGQDRSSDLGWKKGADYLQTGEDRGVKDTEDSPPGAGPETGDNPFKAQDWVS